MTLHGIAPYFGDFMTDLQSDLAEIIHLFSPEDGLHESLLSGTHCIKFSLPDGYTKRHWRACFGIVAQGCKEIILDYH